MAEHWNGGNGGKGSKPRPFSVTQKEYDERWDAIFGKDIPDETEDKITRNNEETQEAKRMNPDSVNGSTSVSKTEGRSSNLCRDAQ